MKTEKLRELILNNEEILMAKILCYAKEHNYTKYTSTLKEAWRISVAGLSTAISNAIEKSGQIPEMTPDDDFTESDTAEYGIYEARRHRSRGVTLGMYLGLMKYYQQSYADLIKESNSSNEEKEYFSQYIKRFFDHMEIGIAADWADLTEKQRLLELQKANREMTNEKNKYLTVFESIYDPIIFVDRNNNIESINNRAAEVFLNKDSGEIRYYSKAYDEKDFDWFIKELRDFRDLNKNEVTIEKPLQTKAGKKIFTIKFKNMLDVSEKYRGTVVIFYDITDRVEIEDKLKVEHEKLEYYAYTDQMTGVANRRTGLIRLENEISLVAAGNKPLSICFVDVDGLKTVNDKYGHAEGDYLIKFIAGSIKRSIRDTDAICRLGGDEFLIIFPESCEADAEKVIGRINDRLDEQNRKHEKPFDCSFSFGIIELSGSNCLSVSDAIHAADEKMYKNKMSKRPAAPEA